MTETRKTTEKMDLAPGPLIEINVRYDMEGRIVNILDDRVGMSLSCSGPEFKEIMRQDRVFAMGSDNVVINHVPEKLNIEYHFKKIEDRAASPHPLQPDLEVIRSLKYEIVETR